MEKIQSFRDLNTWQEGHRLVLFIYRVTKNFPRDEVFGLAGQMRRAAISITSNIAEGFGRPTYQDKSHFYSMALGSLLELENQLLIARDVKYLKPEIFDEVAKISEVVRRLLRGLITKTKSFRVL